MLSAWPKPCPRWDSLADRSHIVAPKVQDIASATKIVMPDQERHRLIDVTFFLCDMMEQRGRRRRRKTAHNPFFSAFQRKSRIFNLNQSFHCCKTPQKQVKLVFDGNDQEACNHLQFSVLIRNRDYISWSLLKKWGLHNTRYRSTEISKYELHCTAKISSFSDHLQYANYHWITRQLEYYRC